MNNKKKVVFVVLLLLVSAAAILITMCTGPCTGKIETAAGGEVPMKCVWAAKAVIMVSVLPVCISVSQFFVKSGNTLRLTAVLLMICSIVIIIITSSAGIGVCEAEGMKCGKMAMLVRADMTALLIISFFEIFLAGRDSGKPKYGF